MLCVGDLLPSSVSVGSSAYSFLTYCRLLHQLSIPFCLGVYFELLETKGLVYKGLFGLQE